MKAESPRLRDLDFEGFLETDFDDFQGFPWGPSLGSAAIRDASGTLDTVPLTSCADDVCFLNHLFYLQFNFCFCFLPFPLSLRLLCPGWNE